MLMRRPYGGGDFSLLCDETFVEHTRLELAFDNSSFERRLVVEGYCNGLICFSSVGGFQRCKGNIYLWNPAVRKLKTLPNPLCPAATFLYRILPFVFSLIEMIIG